MTDFETLAKHLETSDDFRVLRRMNIGAHFVPPQGDHIFRAIYLDLETTGLNADIHEIIEIGMVPFTYNAQGQIHTVEESYSRLREPSEPISEEITNITGITNEMLHGQKIDPSEVFDFTADAGLIIAHNAGFDRVFMEKFCSQFETKPWACSMAEVPWKEEGFDGTRLSHIAAGLGFFYDAHRAIEDCKAGIEILSRTLPNSNETALSRLLKAARQDTMRIWAVNAPYDFKDVLKARKYRWNDGNDGRPKAWFLDVSSQDYKTECNFLEKEIYQTKINLPVTKLTAKDRFSKRV